MNVDFSMKREKAVSREEVRQIFERSELYKKDLLTIVFDAAEIETAAKFSVKFEKFRLHSETTFAFLRSWPPFVVLFRSKQNSIAKKAP